MRGPFIKALSARAALFVAAWVAAGALSFGSLGEGLFAQGARPAPTGSEAQVSRAAGGASTSEQTMWAKLPYYTIPLIDLSRDAWRQIVVGREPGQYLGHPSTVLLPDGKTIIAVYPKGHGGGAIVMKKSTDGGLTWSARLPVPENWATSKETPTIFRLVDKHGAARLVLFSGLYPIRMAYSEDEGKTWTPLRPIGNFGGIVAMSSIVRLRDGAYMAMFHDDGRFLTAEGLAGRERVFRIYKTLSYDGGLTWSAPEVVAEHPKAHLCEPGVVRSPDGKQLACLMRENSRKYNSFVMFSDDEGRTWTAPRELPASLTGDRHVARYARDGRLVVVFRDTTRVSPTKGDFVAWVGRYEDIVRGRQGQYRVRLLDSTRMYDTGYAGLELLPDGTFVATTYCRVTEDEEPIVLSVRFTLAEIDKRAAELAPTQVPVYVSGREGYHTYRIPSLLVTAKGTLLAFCEGRKNSARDHGDIDILVKRSTDHGRTWSAQSIVYEEGGDAEITIGNPCAVLDRDTGIIWLAMTKNNDRVLITFSKDDGITWSPPQDITKDVKRAGWGWYATGPGVGVQLRYGKHKGRLLIPCDHRERKGGRWVKHSHVFFSDDHGKTWALGGTVAEHTDECQLVELADGALLVNMRNYWGREGQAKDKGQMRAEALSRDGGETWERLSFDSTLIEPVCQASIVRYTCAREGTKNRLLFSNPASRTERKCLTVRLSYDEGATWPVARTLYEGPSAYSCLAVLPDMSIGCLYERGEKSPYETITFARFSLEWLTGVEREP